MGNRISLWLVAVVIIVIAVVVALRYTPSPSAPSPAAPSLAVTAPAGGETWQIESTQTISWSTQDIPASDKISVTIRRLPPPPLQSEGQEFDPIVSVNLPDTGSTTWTIADRYPAGTYVLGVTAYASVPITDATSAESKPFHIIPPLAQVLLPLYSGVQWGAPHFQTIDVGTSTFAGAAIDSIAVTNTMSPASVDTPFENYYRSKLLAAGWRVDNMLAAGGPMGGQTAYRKGTGLILVNFSTLFHVVTQTAPSQCPCDVTLTLFYKNK